MSNTLLTISMITREALRVLENNLKFTGLVSRQYDDKFGIEGAKIGTTLNIRKPPRYVGREGQGLSVEGSIETQVPLTLTTQFGVDISFSSADLALSIDDFSKRFLTPAIATVANRIDFQGLGEYLKVANTVGTIATVPTDLLTYLTAGQKLDEEACPMDGLRNIVTTPAMQVQLINTLKTLFQQSTQIANQYTTGRMGTAAGFEWVMDQNVRTHSTGAMGGTPLVNAANQTGSNIITDGWTASTAVLNKGDVITFASVDAVNPQNRQDTGSLRQFVLTDNVTSDASGNATLPIYPALTPSGQFQTVTTSPADNAVILQFGNASTNASKVSPTGLAFHRDAFTMATADLPLPNGVDMAARVSDKQLGISLRMIRAYDINTDQFPCRIDVLFGWATLYAELACRIQS